VSFGGSFGDSSKDGFDFASWGGLRLAPFVIIETFVSSEVRSTGVETLRRLPGASTRGELILVLGESCMVRSGLVRRLLGRNPLVRNR
jgi:hypothetical protein